MSVSEIGLILLIACVVAMMTRKLRLPYSVGLVAAGIGLTLLDGSKHIELTPDLIFKVLLPPLIFEAALQLKWRPFRDNLIVSVTLAGVGVLISALVVAAGMHWVLGWEWLSAGLFGVLIAATDPVSVIAAFREMKVERRLSLLVESESLLNDGVAAVAFTILLSVIGGADVGPEKIGSLLLWMVLGGIASGAAVASALLLLAGRTEDRLVEITLTTIAAYGSFLLAEHFQMSGVLATLTAGLVVGTVGWKGAISGAGRDHVVAFWEYAAFLANSVVFILIGSREAEEATQLFTFGAAVAIVLVLIGRAAAVYPICALFAGSASKVDFRYQNVLFWGGLRGALALALALAIPSTVAEKEAIISAAFAVVAFSIFVQGLTMPRLIKSLRLTSSRGAE